MAITIYRRPCPADTSLGYFNGEQLRIQRPTEGPLAGYTVVEVQKARTRDLVLLSGGWKQWHGEAGEAVEPLAPPIEPRPTLESTWPEGTVQMLAKTGLAELEAFLDRPATTREIVGQLRAAELAGKARKGAAQLFDSWEAAHPPAVLDEPTEASEG